MKKNYFTLLIALCSLLIFACASAAKANPDEVSLSTAIRDAAARMESRGEGREKR